MTGRQRVPPDGFGPVESDGHFALATDIHRQRYARYKPTEDERLRDLWGAGLSCKAISETLKMPIGSVSYRAGVLGLSPRTPGPKPDIEWCRFCREAPATEDSTTTASVNGEIARVPYPLCAPCLSHLLVSSE